ncbi:hypothetical protein SteCoe_24341 [Stentor coeruleus]|uniref:Major facilitator superfamily (MFS) profile domain-containing protein n=1 Tax=Stentor coeruleus TaxID=5963 RepID=A0A1R2BI71_9CILI|nr:hypothetical protein SteCoe_24341 [Stentor coeruleus]
MQAKVKFSVKIVVLLVILTEHALAFMMPTILAYMIHGLLSKNTDSEISDSDISYYTGVIEGSNRFMAFIGCLIWGTISDNIGRKYSLLIVLCGICATSFGFSLAQSFEAAVAWRMFSGVFAGVIPIMKAMLRDISDDSNIAVLYSYFGTGYGLASIVGPIIGGVFSHPYRHLAIFDTPFFHDFPYFLALFTHSIFCIIAFLLILYFVPYKAPEQSNTQDKKSLFTNKNYLTSLFIFGFIAIVQFAYRILMTLWVKTDRNHSGLGWETEEKVGFMNSLSGIIVTIFPLIFTPILSNSLGVIKSLILLLCSMIPIVIGISWTSELDGIPLWGLLVILNGLSIGITTVLVGFISIAVSNSVPSNITGAAMGFAQSSTALFRAFATTSTAWLYGASRQWTFGFPFDVHFAFMCIALACLIDIATIKFALDPAVEKRKQSDKEIPLIEKKV